MAKPKKAVPVKLATLVELFGKQVDDPAVQSMIAKAGKVTVKSDYIIAKEAGFDFSLARPEGAKKKQLSTLFLFPDGKDGHRGFEDLPEGFAFTTRPEVLAALPAPESSWKLGKGKVPVDTKDVMHDTWQKAGLSICVCYRGGHEVGHIQVTRPIEAKGGHNFSTYPLHFETKPADAPPDAELVGMGLLVAWAAQRYGLPAKHAKTDLGKQLLAKKITPRTFVIQACNGKLSSLDFDPKLGDFLYEYLHSIVDDEGAREKIDKQIAKLLHTAPDRRQYNDDFVGTFDNLKSAFYVPDSWAAVDRIAPIINARAADFQATGFEKPPKLDLYEKAAGERDKVTVTPTRATIAKASADDALANELVALIGRSLKDKEVKAIITRAGMPVGKKIDQQANPALGVAYMGTNMQIDGKKQLGVDAVWFYASKQKSYIRGIGAEVEFIGYPGPLPRGLSFSDSRADVAKKLGKPKSTYEKTDYWQKDGRQVTCDFARGKLVELYVGTIKNY